MPKKRIASKPPSPATAPRPAKQPTGAKPRTGMKRRAGGQQRMATKGNIYDKLRRHFRADPAVLPVIRRGLEPYCRANLHAALEQFLATVEGTAVWSGVVPHHEYESVSLSRLAIAQTAGWFFPGPLSHVDLTLDRGRNLAVIARGLCLFEKHGEPFALLLDETRHFPHELAVEVMGRTREATEAISREIQHRVERADAFRGKVLSIERGADHSLVLLFHELPQISRDELILPDETLARIERHTLGFRAHADKLRSAGRHLKRGILLYGPPGTGKTLTSMYLASQMPERTVVIMTGGGMGLIEAACGIARMAQPATLILEDVDLVGTERGYQSIGCNAILFELLNQMDGLADDSDLLFILTTNRPDILEPALASRPGRIDQAIEIPLPNPVGRKRLFERYQRGLSIDPKLAWDEFVERTEGVTGAFIRELLRKAMLFAADEAEGDGTQKSAVTTDNAAATNGLPMIYDRHLRAAHSELTMAGGAMTHKLLGFAGG